MYLVENTEEVSGRLIENFIQVSDLENLKCYQNNSIITINK